MSCDSFQVSRLWIDNYQSFVARYRKWVGRWACRAFSTLVLLAAACTADEEYGTVPDAAVEPIRPRATAPATGSPPTVASAARPSAPRKSTGTPSVEASIVTQYRRFWVDALPAAAAAPPARRSAILAPVTAEPQLSHLVRSLASLDARGQRDYGADVPVRQTVQVSGELALVDGCLDSSHSGVADAATGAPVTRGVPRNPVRADLTRGRDGVWRVSAVTYPPDSTC